MPTTVVTAPTTYPISLSEAKAHLRVTESDDDIYITALIKAATAEAETFTQRALMTQTWDVFSDYFCSMMEMPKGPLQSVTSVKYIDTDGTQQTEAASVYTVDTDSDPGIVRLAYNQSWSSVRDQANAVTIRIVAGYGNAAAVPMPIKQAMLIHVAHLYESREPAIIGATVAMMPMSYESLLSSYRVMRF